MTTTEFGVALIVPCFIGALRRAILSSWGTRNSPSRYRFTSHAGLSLHSEKDLNNCEKTGRLVHLRTLILGDVRCLHFAKQAVPAIEL